MRLLTLICLILMIVTGCSSTSEWVPPPDMISAENSPGSSQSQEWWRTYKLALDQKESAPDKSCIHFKNLSAEPAFPLKGLAHIRAIQTCSKANIEITWQEELITDWAFLESEQIDARLQWTQAFGEPTDLPALMIQKSKMALPRHEKEEWVEKAIAQESDVDLKKQYQKRLYSIAPRKNPQPEESDYLAVAYDYRRVRDFKQSRRYFEKVLYSKRSDLSLRLQAQKSWAKTWKLERNEQAYLKGLVTLKKIAAEQFLRKKNRNYKQYHSVVIRLIRRYWTLGQIRNAKKEMRKLEKKLSGKYPLDTIHWLRGRMAEEKQNFAQAVKHFSRAIDETTSAESRKLYLWYRSWNYRKISQFQKAHEDYETLLRETEDDDHRNSYWYARNLKDLEFTESALVQFERLIENDPFGYYGLLAHRALQRPLPAIQNEDVASSKEYERMPDKIHNRVEWLVSLGEDKVAQEYLSTVSRTIPDEQRFDYLHLLARSGRYLPLFIELNKIDPSERHAILKETPDLLFPQPYKKMVQEASEKFGVEAAMIYSIMRQESAFNPRARSVADAFGLMQILETIAKKQARKNQRELASYMDLYEPGTNIFLGASLLKSLFDKQNGQFIAAVASYNANEPAIANWISTRYRNDPVEFIEDIPYQETQQYVKLVMRNYVFYKRLKDRTQETTFPDWCLQPLKNTPRG